jgi:hypothetical protein
VISFDPKKIVQAFCRFEKFRRYSFLPECRISIRVFTGRDLKETSPFPAPFMDFRILISGKFS